MAAILKIEGNKQSFMCGGTLVSARTVVTAAHCVHAKKKPKGLMNTEILVLLGAHNLGDPNDPEKRSMRVESIEIHQTWNAAVDGRFTGDIAILVLAKNITFNDYIKPVCLATNLPTSVQSGTVAGWGRQENQDYGTSNKLPKKIDIPIVETNTCHDKTKLLATGSWEESFCAGREGVSVCDGDSGSGFYVNLNGTYYLKGIVSNSALKEDCVLGYHATFTDASKYTPFITERFMPDDGVIHFRDKDILSEFYEEYWIHIAIAASALALTVILIICLVWCCYRCRKLKNTQELPITDPSNVTPLTPFITVTTPSITSSVQTKTINNNSGTKTSTSVYRYQLSQQSNAKTFEELKSDFFKSDLDARFKDIPFTRVIQSSETSERFGKASN